MMEKEPSRTAMTAAASRALHLLHRGPEAILADWMAWPLVGADADEIVALGRTLVGDQERAFASWFAARSRLTEDWLRASGAAQYVVLGAGLDSYAWRDGAGVRVFEVDHPATQQWKRSRIEALGAPEPEALTWVPVDFEQDDLGSALATAGLDSGAPVFVSWLGVVPYLTTEAILRTLDALPDCSLAVGYVPPHEGRDEEAQALGATVESFVASLGEPWLTLPTSEQFASLVAQAGFEVVEDVGPRDVEARLGCAAMNYERMALLRKNA